MALRVGASLAYAFASVPEFRCAPRSEGEKKVRGSEPTLTLSTSMLGLSSYELQLVTCKAITTFPGCRDPCMLTLGDIYQLIILSFFPYLGPKHTKSKQNKQMKASFLLWKRAGCGVPYGSQL